MSRHDKLMAKILWGSSDNPFPAAAPIALYLGFEERIRGDHHILLEERNRDCLCAATLPSDQGYNEASEDSFQRKIVMRVAIQFTAQQELKALPILLRHSPGMILPNRTYVIAVEAASALREAGIEFTELGNESHAPQAKGAIAGERV